MARRYLQPKQHTEALAHIDYNVSRSLRFEHDSPSLPIEVLDVIRESDAGDLSARRQ